MLFQTWNFLVFFIPLLIVYVCLRNTRLRLPLLLIASYLFYACWDWRFPFFLLGITFIDYFVGRGLEQQKRGWLLAISLTANIGILCCFKYLGFLLENVQTILEWCHLDTTLPEVNWILPVGLSFFTFKSMSYTCDIYLGKRKAETNFWAYAGYVSFFPQLVAGPIERSESLLPQLNHRMPLGKEDIAAGISIFVSGLFKKIVMADMLAVYVDMIYDDPLSYGGAALLLASYAFSWQIYFDFSGYSDMARGVARLMGFRTILNFDNPYVSVDVRDFWRRWHISLSTWFRDYVYIPLGGSRCAKLRVWFNLMVTMLVSGLWHGAAWTFIAWGGLNGIGNIVSSTFDKSEWYKKVPKLLKQWVVFNFITLTWVFFRASDFECAFDVLKGIFTWSEGETLFPVFPAVMIGLVWGYELLWASKFRPFLERNWVRIIVVAFVLISILLLGNGANSQFIYQQF